MQIVTLVKQVPDKEARLRINESGTWVREEELPFQINEPDEYALEEALRLKEKFGGEVVVLSLGKERVRESIRKALAMGADRAVFVKDDGLEDEGLGASDALGVAAVFAGVISKEPFDLVLCGVFSEDFGSTQVGPALAEFLHVPHATMVMEVTVDESARRVRVKRELEGGLLETAELPMPCVLAVQAGLNYPRYASLKGIMQAKKKEVREVDGQSPASSAGAGRVVLTRVSLPQKGTGAEMLTGTPKEIAEKLYAKLTMEAKVL